MSNKNNDVERPYIVDGIREYDNPLPSWWVVLFWFTIIFGVAYLGYYIFGGATLDEELYADRAAYEEMMKKQNAGVETTGEDLLASLKSKDMIDAGAVHYKTNCAPCHGQLGEGLVGPNLTDKHWVNGGSAEDIIKVITDGVPAKGMVPWKAILGPKKIKETAAFIISLEGTNPPNAKAAEGEVYERQ